MELDQPPGTHCRNTVRLSSRQKPYTFTLTLGPRSQLVAETHNGNTTTLTIQRTPAVRLDATA
jgi:hypothetical protein